jgi:hypothetical protein
MKRTIIPKVMNGYPGSLLLLGVWSLDAKIGLLIALHLRDVFKLHETNG